MSAANEATETSPLIQPAERNPPTEEQLHTDDSGWTENAIRTAALAAAFLMLYAFADVLKYISTVRLIELGVCREHYIQHDPGVIDHAGSIPEHLCKSPAIQQRLAHLRGYSSALEATVGLLLTIPYGLLVDRLGGPLLAGINVLGYLLSCAWLLVVCFYWSAFPIWSAVLAPLFRVVGGGSPILASVIYSIAAKHIPGANRSICFFLFMAAQFLTEILTIMFAALLLDQGFLFTPMILNFPVGLLCIATLFFIHPGSSPVQLQDHQGDPDDEGVDAISSIQRGKRIVSQLLRDRNILVLIATVPVAKLVNPITELMLQYMPKKFDISLASASRALSIQALESLVWLIAILPILKKVAQVKFHVASINFDRYIVQYGFLVMGLGCLIMAFSQALTFFILGLLVFTLGCSTRPALQSLLTDLVRREDISVLYAVIAVGDGIGSAAGALVLNRALAISIGWDNKLYLGLPFDISAMCYIFAFVASLFVGSRATHPKRDV